MLRGNRSINACRSHGRIVTLEAVVPGSSVQSTVMANTVGVGLRCYTALGTILPAGIATSWLTKASKEPIRMRGLKSPTSFRSLARLAEQLGKDPHLGAQDFRDDRHRHISASLSVGHAATEGALRASCGPEVQRLCRGISWENVGAIKCLSSHRMELSPICDAYFTAEGHKPKPVTPPSSRAPIPPPHP